MKFFITAKHLLELYLLIMFKQHSLYPQKITYIIDGLSMGSFVALCIDFSYSKKIWQGLWNFF
jgi:hypothetical protein